MSEGASDLTTISDAELDALLGAPIGDALVKRRLSVAQALRVVERQPRQVPVGRIDPQAGSTRTFFDPSTADAAPRIQLERVLDEHGNETFLLRKRIGYVDPELGVFLVPVDLETFHCDLTSTPQLFTWLVPQTGKHLPAALVHDAMILGKDEPPTYFGPTVDRVTADRIFRDGMGELGTSIIRRWLVWTAVAVASAWSQPNFVRRWWWRLVIAVTALAIVVLGGLATVDFFDCRDALPWMWKDRTWGLELMYGGLFAVAVPVVLATLLWWGRWRAGVIFGIGLAFLLHVTLAIVVLLSLYTLAENVVKPRSVKQVLLALAGLAGAGVGSVYFLWWACHS